MKIQLINGGVSRDVNTIIGARLRDGLDGTNTLNITLHTDDVAYVGDDTIVVYNQWYYNVTGIRKYMDGEAAMCEVTCEHVSYALNDDAYKLDGFEYSGTVAGALAAALSGTGFTVGTVEAYGSIDILVGSATRRAIVTTIAALAGCEITYNAYQIGICSHRGSTAYIELLDTDNVTDVAVTRSVLDGTNSYDVNLGRAESLSCGDNIHIKFSPLGLDVQTRIIAIEYNPYNPFDVAIDVGDYVPDILDLIARDAETAAKVDEIENKLINDYLKIVDLNAGIDTYIGTNTGKANVVAACSGTYQTIAGMSNYALTSSLDASIGAYIDGTTGTAKVVAACSGTYQTVSGMSNYVQKTTLDASIGAYIDGSTGTAKVVAACSGTYATTASIASIQGDVSENSANIALVVGTGKLVGTTGTVSASIIVSAVNGAGSSVMINADKIQMTGTTTFLKASDVGSSGTTTIDGGRITTGTISAERINTDSLKLDTLYSGNNIAVKASYTGNTVYIGGFTGSTTFGTVYLYAANYLYIRSSPSASGGINITPSSGTIEPTETGYLGTSSNAWDYAYMRQLYVTSQITKQAGSTAYCGTSTYPWNYGYFTNLYATTLYLNGTQITSILAVTDIKKIYATGSNLNYIELTTGNVFQPSSSLTMDLGSSSYWFGNAYIQTICLGGNTTYYITANSSRELRPSSTSTTYPCYLGTSTYYWHYAYIGSNTVMIGSSSASKLGFFGTTAVACQTISTASQNMGYTSATSSNYLIILNNLVGILKLKYGLID